MISVIVVIMIDIVIVMVMVICVIFVISIIIIINRHLGLINASPSICVFPPNDFVHYSITIKKARNIQNYGQDFINHIFPLMGGPLCENKTWDFYIISVT